MGKSKSKVVDLKPETISEDQLQDLQGIVQALNKLHFDIGQVEMRKLNIADTIRDGNVKLGEVRKELQEQYGEHDIDITTGSINYDSNDKSPNT